MSTEKASVKPVKKTAVKPSLSTGKKTLSTGEKAKVKTASPSVGVAKKVVKKPVVKPAVKPAVKTDATALAGASTTASKPGIKRLAGGGFAKMVKVRKPDGTIAKKLVRCDENGNIIKPQKKAVAGAVASKPEQTASLNLASMLKNGSAKTDEISAVNEKTEDKAPAENVGETNKNKDFDRSKFLSRVRSRHSFLSALDEGKKASEVTNIETARVDEAPKQVNTGEYVEEQIETDASVTNLENSVLNKQLDNMTGQGDSKGVSTSASQLGVSGQAKNPNASKTNSPISNANSVKSQNLTGSFVNLASRDSGYVCVHTTLGQSTLLF